MCPSQSYPSELSSVHSHIFLTCSASCTADFADVLSFFSGALLNEIWLVSLGQQGRAHFHRFNSFISNGNCRVFVITLAPVPSHLFVLWSVVAVFKMLAKTEAQESLEFGLKIHSLLMFTLLDLGGE